MLAFFRIASLVTPAILTLALVLPAWPSALIVTVVLFAIAPIVAVMGKKQVQQATPSAPERTVENVK